jgi:glycosyltransferase involved in cell wall biosynthesis
MTLNHITKLPKQWYRTLTSLTARDVYLITDASNWIFDWIGHYVAAHLQERYQVSTHLSHEVTGLRNQLIHFIDRYAYLDGTSARLHSSNRVFLTWFHGDSADSNPAMQQLFTQLLQAEAEVQRIVVSCQISRQSLLQAGIPESKLIEIPLGVDLVRFIAPTGADRLKARAALGIPQEAICIGSFQKDGTGWGDGLEPKLIKGPDVFLEVMAQLSARYKNLLVLLTGPSRGYIKQGLEQLDIPYIHHFLSDYHEIARYYHALDLYLITSRCEGGPAALLESWATGVPVVSTRVGMPADLIKHSLNGMLAEVEDITSLTHLTLELIENEAQRDQCRRQALEDVKQYHWPLIADRYYRELYQPFLQGPTRAGEQL